MKKTAFLLMFLTAFGALSARTVKLTMSDYENVSFSDKGFTITAAKASAATKPAYNASMGDLRIYAKGTLTIAATDENILGVEFILSHQGKERLPSLTVDNGTATVTNDPDYSATWSGNSKSVTFTVGAKADFGSKPKESGQLCFTAIRITTDGAGADEDDTPDLTKVYEFTQGRARYYGTNYTKNPCFIVEIFSDDITISAEESVEGTGAYATFDIYTDNAQSFIGTYTTTLGKDKVGGLTSGTASQWHVCGRGICESAYISSGSVTFSCTPSGKYNVKFNVTDSEGNLHEGAAYGLKIDSYTENGSNYPLSNVCTDSDVNALVNAEVSQRVFSQNGAIVIEQGAPADVWVFNVLGQKITTLQACEQATIPVQNGIYLVKIGQGISKIVVR